MRLQKHIQEIYIGFPMGFFGTPHKLREKSEELRKQVEKLPGDSHEATELSSEADYLESLAKESEEY